MSPLQLDFLRHIEQECTFLLDHDRETLLHDPIVGRAVIRSLEVIGEAVKKLPVELCDRYPHVAWADMAGMRDVLIHHYFGIDHVIVWSVLEIEIPALQEQLQRIIAQESLG